MQQVKKEISMFTAQSTLQYREVNWWRSMREKSNWICTDRKRQIQTDRDNLKHILKVCTKHIHSSSLWMVPHNLRILSHSVVSPNNCASHCFMCTISLIHPRTNKTSGLCSLKLKNLEEYISKKQNRTFNKHFTEA
jgi:hypothetical protein